MNRAFLTSFKILFLLSTTSVLIINPANANETYISQTYGGPNIDTANSLIQTGDGGYAIAGYTTSFGAGSKDFWLVKTNASGSHEWNQTYGGTGEDSALTLVQTCDGGYALAGRTDSFGVGIADFWLVKTDADGNYMWNQTYGGLSYEVASSLVQTCDGGYALAGCTMSFGAGSKDFWLVKTNASGSHEWNQTYGGTDSEVASSLVQTCDCGYALAGYTSSFGAGSSDFWLVKTDADGNYMWNQTYGGMDSDFGFSLVQTCDGGYALAGRTDSFGAGYDDFWLVKTDASGSHEWNQTYGGTGEDSALTLVQTCDGGYALAGYTVSFGVGIADFWLVKTDADGNPEWNQTYGGTNIDIANSLIQTGDGGYAIAGLTFSFSVQNSDFLLVKTDASGVIPEFPAWTPLLLVIVFTVAIIIYRRKLLKKQTTDMRMR